MLLANPPSTGIWLYMELQSHKHSEALDCAARPVRAHNVGNQSSGRQAFGAGRNLQCKVQTGPRCRIMMQYREMWKTNFTLLKFSHLLLLRLTLLHEFRCLKAAGQQGPP